MSRKKKDNDVKKNSNNGKKKFIIIGIIILFVICLGGVFGYIYYNSNKSVGSEWGDKYFNFVKDVKNGENSKVKFEDNSTFEFIEIPDVSDPVMVVNQEVDGKKGVDIYYINGEDIDNVIDLGFEDVKLLYNIDNKEYNWYGYSKSDTEEKYMLISDKINKSEKDDDTSVDYTFKIDEEVSVDTVNGDKISIPKFDTVFIEADVDVNEFKFDSEFSDKELKEAFSDGVSEYKDITKITDTKVKEEVSKKEKEIVAKKDEMKKAEEEVQKKKEEEARKAEEARKKAEEEAKKGLAVNNHRIKYGTYKGIAGEPSEGCSFTINADKTFKAVEYNGTVVTGTYKLGTENFAQDIVPHYVEAIQFYKSNGEKYQSLTAWSDTVIGDNDIFMLNYAG